MDSKDKILLRAMAILVIVGAVMLTATDADAARRFFNCGVGWPGFFDMWPWS